MYNAQPLSTLVLRLSPGVPHVPSPKPYGICSEPLESCPSVFSDTGHRSAVIGVLNSTTLLDHSHGLREASATSRPDERGASDIPQKPTRPILAPCPPNKFELRVFPDKHTITNDALLKCTPYIVNVQYIVLICTDCRCCINPDRALEHLDHPHCKAETTFSEQVNKRFPGLVSGSIHPPETTEAVFRLAIPVDKYKYTVCSRCHRGYINVPTWQRHACRNAETTLARQRPYFSSHVQTFFQAPRICYFPVELPDSATDGTKGNDFELFTTNFQELAVSDGEIHEPDYRELNQFLQKEG